MKHRILIPVLAAALSLALSSRAAPPPTLSATQRAFAEAQRLFDAGEPAKAAAGFQELYAKTRSPNAHYMLARSLAALDRLPEAHEEMSTVLREATDAAQRDPKRYETTRDAAAAQLAVLDRKVGKVIVVLVEPDPAATITLGGAPLPPAKLGVPIAVAPGVVEIEETAPGGPPVRAQTAIAAGETKTVVISGKRTPIQPEPSHARLPPELPSAKSSPVRAAGFVVGGLGIAGLLAGAVTGVSALNNLSRLKEECGGVRCVDPQYAAVVDNGQRMQTITNALLPTGAALAVAGGLMIALGGHADKGHPAATREIFTCLTPTRGGAGLWIASTF